MKAPSNQTQMVAGDAKAKLAEDKEVTPVTPENDTDETLVREASAEEAKPKPKNVKIRAIREIRPYGMVIKPGQTCYVDEDAAADFCKSYDGAYAFRGQRMPGDETPRAKIQRAEYVR